jgi:glycosyltransferase involved in cell wall biosynthesis
MVVFAHTPPPHHGQSAMVKLMLDLLARPAELTPARPNAQATRPLRLYHVNARLSREMGDVGEPRFGKLPFLFKYCLQAIALRLRHAASVFYYVPAPPARTPLWRDLFVMAACRPFFPKLVLHWHAGGLAEWLEQEGRPWEKRLARRFLGKADLSLVLRPFNRHDADYFAARRTELVCNGIPDPCPDFERTLQPHRLASATARRQVLQAPPPAKEAETARTGARLFRVLYLSMCRREKGLFDTLEAIALANASRPNQPLRLELTVAGDFWSPADRAEFDRRIQAPDLIRGTPLVRHVGFASGAAKDELLRASDCLSFPSYLPEGFPLILAEAMAYGLPLVTTTWRQLPEILPPGYPGVVEPRAPAQLADKLLELAGRDYDPRLRAHFTANYTVERFGARLREVLENL